MSPIPGPVREEKDNFLEGEKTNSRGAFTSKNIISQIFFYIEPIFYPETVLKLENVFVSPKIYNKILQ